MKQKSVPSWHGMRTPESRRIESLLRPIFPHSDAYRYNSASIRVRVVDPRFEGKTDRERDALVEPLLRKLPRKIQGDIMNVLVYAPSELGESIALQWQDAEFENPSPSIL